MQCLVDLGWAGTSTTEVARRAGVSRGAQQHHYPTKMELVTAAMEHMLERQRLAFEQAFAVLPAQRRNVEGALDLFWNVVRQPPALALMELAMAARTDNELRPVCIDLNQRVLEVIQDTFRRLFPDAALPDELEETMLRSMFALFVGLSLQNSLDGDEHGHQRAVITQIKSIAAVLIPPASPRSPGS
ncbi:TetR/AcrR family transcriptional regulator [Actinomadura craniellae]|uniref:TetR/AcrR family transcriptional regulator n=2 Tax=Actinomadura craniellae TaxID=2231787 RepID=A0A365GV15_9ACTN|nr:TetR/AcrR family transcriptional regulator [Actinomadura craniellae]